MSAVYGILPNKGPQNKACERSKGPQVRVRDTKIKPTNIVEETGDEPFNWFVEQVAGQSMWSVREDSLEVVKTYKTIKNAIWQSAIQFTADGRKIPRREQVLDISQLLGLMEEI